MNEALINTGVQQLQSYFTGPLSVIWVNPMLRGTIGRYKGLEGDELQAFADRLEAVGQDEPVITWELPADHPARELGALYSMIAGVNRFTALSLKNKQREAEGKEPLPIKFTVRDDIKSDEQALLITIRENTDKQDLGYIDYALNMRELYDTHKWSMEAIGKEMKCSTGAVSQHLSAIRKIDEKWWPYINDGTFGVKAIQNAIMIGSPELRNKALQATLDKINEARDKGDKFSGEDQVRFIVNWNNSQQQTVPAAVAPSANQMPQASNKKADDPFDIGSTPAADAGDDPFGLADNPTPVTTQQNATPAPPASSGIRASAPNLIRQRGIGEVRTDVQSMVATVEGKPDLEDPQTKFFWTFDEYLAGRVDWLTVRNVANNTMLDKLEDTPAAAPAPVAAPAPKGKTGGNGSSKKGGKAKAA